MIKFGFLQELKNAIITNGNEQLKDLIDLKLNAFDLNQYFLFNLLILNFQTEFFTYSSNKIRSIIAIPKQIDIICIAAFLKSASSFLSSGIKSDPAM